MKSRIKSISLIFLLPLFVFSQKNTLPYQNKLLPIDVRVKDLVGRMTLEEKAGQLNLLNGGEPTGPGIDYSNKDLQLEIIKKGRVGAFLNISGTANIKLYQEAAIKKSRLGIPLIFGMDVIHGYRTIFPIPLAEACSWDLNLIEKNAAIAAKEASAAGINWTFAPMADISNDPRWGRVMEGAGEDPFLCGLVTAARVRGFQGKLTSNNVLACIKHYGGYGAVEGGREYNYTDFSRIALWNKHLPSYKKGIEAGAATIMNGFNLFENVPVTANKYLLQDVLKSRWKFKGFIVSDWTSMYEMIPHGFAKDSLEAAVLSLNAGSMMDMASDVVINNISTIAKNRLVDMGKIDAAVSAVLTQKFKLGLFDNPYAYCDSVREKTLVFTDENRIAARQAAEKSVVLLKNSQQVLPMLNTNARIALVGYLAKSKKDMFDFWTFRGNYHEAVSIFEGVKNTFSNVEYMDGYDTSVTANNILINEAVNKSKNADYIIVTIGWPGYLSGEDRSFANIHIPQSQLELLKELKKNGKPIIVLVNSGRPLVLTEILPYCDAILQCWILGSETGNAIGNILKGEVNPSAKTVMSFPYHEGQIPVYYNRYTTSRPGINLQGGEWQSRYRDFPNEALFPFGYGLSYTSYQYQNLQLSDTIVSAKKPLTASITVTNTGNYDGEEIVQLYIHDFYSTIVRPYKELKAYQKIFIKKGETKVVKFNISAADLCFYDQDGKPVLENGKMEVMIGKNAQDVLKQQFKYIQ